MLRNHQRQLWFCRNMEEEQPKWLLLNHGVFQRKVSKNSEKIRFYPMGSEQYPQEEVQSTVKLISLQLHLSADDEAQQEILAADGRSVSIVQWDSSKKSQNNGKICEALVEVVNDGSGLSQEPMEAEIRLHCGPEQDAEMQSGVNGLYFTAKNKEVSANE